MVPQHWFDKLERRFEWCSIPGLASFLVGMNAVVWIMTMMRSEFAYRLILFPPAVWQGEWWRLLTFAIVPPHTAPLWMIFWLLLLYKYAGDLEAEWGDFRFNLFYGAGVVATAAAAMLTGHPMTNVTLNASLFLAFATLYPDFTVNIYMIIPVKVRWLAALMALGLAWRFLVGGSGARWEVASGVLSYLLFFGGDHWLALKRLWRRRGG
ncbi:MAG: hypothetical protein HY925_01480 [Elusimicrobia bacterium]|nr:hypothetical protein [Elusimicrobiota bacterium]